MDLISMKVKLATPIDAGVQHQFPSDWTEGAMARAIGTIDDQDDHTRILVLFEDGPGARAAVWVGITKVVFYDPLGVGAVAADPTGTGEGSVPPLGRASSGQGADQMTKVYLVDRKDAIFVYGELEMVKAQMIASAGRGDWVQLQRVNKDAVVLPDDIVINPHYVVSLQSERL